MAPSPLWQHNEEEEESGKKERIRGIAAFRCTSYQEQCHHNVLSSCSEHTPLTGLSKSAVNTHTTWKAHQTHSPPRPSLWLSWLFSAAAFVVATAIWIHYAQCQYWCNKRCTSDRYSLLNERACRRMAGEDRKPQQDQRRANSAKRFPAPRRQPEGAARWLCAERGGYTSESIFSSVLLQQPVNSKDYQRR